MSKTFISSGAFSGLSLGQLLPIAEAAKIYRIELSSGLIAAPSELDAAEAALERGFEFLIHNYFPASTGKAFVLNLADPDAENRKQSVDFAVRAMTICQRLRVPFYSVHAGFGPSLRSSDLGSPEGYARHSAMTADDHKRALERLGDSLDKLQDVSRQLGVSVLLENNVVAPKTASRMGWHGLLLAGADEICKTLGKRPKLGLLLDTAHAAVTCQSLGQDFEAFLRSVRPFTKALHISHTDRLVDGNAPLQAATPGLERLREFARLPVVVEVYGLTPQAIQDQLALAEMYRRPAEEGLVG